MGFASPKMVRSVGNGEDDAEGVEVEVEGWKGGCGRWVDGMRMVAERWIGG